MSAITTHVLDLSRGRPAARMELILERRTGKDAWREIAVGRTDDDGRASKLMPPGMAAEAGIYRLTFQTGSYFTGLNVETFYPFVSIVFEIKAMGEHYHVPLLVSPFGYSTYRGS